MIRASVLWKEILDKLDMQKIEKWLVMATLIATFTITTTFTLPRVYEDHGLNEEMAKFARKLDFVVCVITVTVAMVSSKTAIVLCLGQISDGKYNVIRK
ncbi:hypothetical protein LWI29_013204 [Acer saccharum]|uniref:PGG domain-containing protein n=1 Tax=Acer saccharum TaxID=4024 RepID=A0AA39SZF4_ACESA|nr:hypothetical protein LWI29_013204 [Acer saccharum]